MKRTSITIRPNGADFAVTVETMDNGMRTSQTYAYAPGARARDHQLLAGAVKRVAPRFPPESPARQT